MFKLRKGLLAASLLLLPLSTTAHADPCWKCALTVPKSPTSMTTTTTTQS